LDNGFETQNINISTAAAVTAYARILMSLFKNNPLLPNLYYSDTDSAYFDQASLALPDFFISPTESALPSKLNLNLEGVFDNAVF